MSLPKHKKWTALALGTIAGSIGANFLLRGNITALNIEHTKLEVRNTALNNELTKADARETALSYSLNVAEGKFKNLMWLYNKEITTLRDQLIVMNSTIETLTEALENESEENEQLRTLLEQNNSIVQAIDKDRNSGDYQIKELLEKVNDLSKILEIYKGLLRTRTRLMNRYINQVKEAQKKIKELEETIKRLEKEADNFKCISKRYDKHGSMNIVGETCVQKDGQTRLTYNENPNSDWNRTYIGIV